MTLFLRKPTEYWLAAEEVYEYIVSSGDAENIILRAKIKATSNQLSEKAQQLAQLQQELKQHESMDR